MYVCDKNHIPFLIQRKWNSIKFKIQIRYAPVSHFPFAIPHILFSHICKASTKASYKFILFHYKSIHNKIE